MSDRPFAPADRLSESRCLAAFSVPARGVPPRVASAPGVFAHMGRAALLYHRSPVEERFPCRDQPEEPYRNEPRSDRRSTPRGSITPSTRERAALQLDALALALRSALDQVTVPLARAAAAFVSRQSWFAFGYARIGD